MFHKFPIQFQLLTGLDFNRLNSRIKTVLAVSTKTWPLQEDRSKREDNNKKINNNLKTLKRTCLKGIINVNIEKGLINRHHNTIKASQNLKGKA